MDESCLVGRMHRPQSDYMERVQRRITTLQRRRVVEELFEVRSRWHMMNTSIFLAVSYMDRYLSHRLVDSSQLRLVGMTCIYIAAKFEDTRSPKAVNLCSRLAPQIVHLERDVLNVLSWKLCTLTAAHFVETFLCAAEGSRARSVESIRHTTKCLAISLVETSLLEYYMIRFGSTDVAASAVFLAFYYMDRPSKIHELTEYTGLEVTTIRPCIQTLHVAFTTLKSACCKNKYLLTSGRALPVRSRLVLLPESAWRLGRKRPRETETEESKTAVLI